MLAFLARQLLGDAPQRWERESLDRSVFCPCTPNAVVNKAGLESSKRVQEECKLRIVERGREERPLGAGRGGVRSTSPKTMNRFLVSVSTKLVLAVRHTTFC